MRIDTYSEVWKLWQSLEEPIKNYVYSKVKDHETAQDLSHEVLLKIHRSCCSDRIIGNPRSWCFQIAHNTVMDHFKERKKTSLDKKLNPSEGKNENVYVEIMEFLPHLIGFLPETYAEPLRLRYVQGMKQKAVSQSLGLSLAATKSRILRGREMLRKEIETCFFLETTDRSLEDFCVKPSCAPLKKFIKN